MLQLIEVNASALRKMVDVSVLSDGNVIVFMRKRLTRRLLTVMACFSIPILVLIMCALFEPKYWMVSAACPFMILFCIYTIRDQALTIAVNMVNRSVSIQGRWRKTKTFSWDSYQGHETYCSVKDFPEEFHIKFMDNKKIRSIKLADINPLFHKSTSANYVAISALWEFVEKTMAGEVIPE